MTVEIERRFVLSTLPNAPTLGDGVTMRQGYLAEEGDVAVRVRITPTWSKVTIKAGRGLSRTEIEFDVTPEQAEALWVHTEGRRIDKVRHRVALDGPGDLVDEVDLYHGALAGLCTGEVEFDSEDIARSFDPPAWLGREVTGQPGWSNAELARSGRIPN